MPVTIVAAIARNGVIGKDGRLPWRLPGELPRFKELTMGHVLVMGRRTYESISRPLPGRSTVVVTRSPEWQPEGGLPEGVSVAGSVEAALMWAGEIDTEVFVVGGSSVYAGALPLADTMVLTWVDAEPDGDAFFPAVDWEQWREVAREAHDGWQRATYERASIGVDAPPDESDGKVAVNL